MWWWVSAVVTMVLIGAYLTWLGARVARLHRRAEAATAALDASLLRRAAAAAVLAEQLSATAPEAATDLYATARTALDTDPQDREAAENDLTQALRVLPERAPKLLPDPVPAWPGVVTASRRVSLARQVHTDVVRDALSLRRRVPVRVFGMARRFPEPGYFDVDDPGLDDHPDAGAVQATER